MTSFLYNFKLYVNHLFGSLVKVLELKNSKFTYSTKPPDGIVCGMANLWRCKAFWGASDQLAEEWSVSPGERNGYADFAIIHHGQSLAETILKWGT